MGELFDTEGSAQNGKDTPTLLLKVFDRFAIEHSKFAYFLLAVSVAASVYAVDNVTEGNRHRLDPLAFGAVGCWMLSFVVGCGRVIKMLTELHEPIAWDDGVNLRKVARRTGSTAKHQYRLFVAGVVFYGGWVLATYVLSSASTT